VFGSQGDAPKVVMAASGIEDSFYSVLTARKLAETFGMVVVLLCDAGLAKHNRPSRGHSSAPTGWRRPWTRRRCRRA
jgi:pyruvate/2-oxoacid:ferredoxin oxidoreductase alpha subunit